MMPQMGKCPIPEEALVWRRNGGGHGREQSWGEADRDSESQTDQFWNLLCLPREVDCFCCCVVKSTFLE